MTSARGVRPCKIAARQADVARVHLEDVAGSDWTTCAIRDPDSVSRQATIVLAILDPTRMLPASARRGLALSVGRQGRVGESTRLGRGITAVMRLL